MEDITASTSSRDGLRLDIAKALFDSDIPDATRLEPYEQFFGLYDKQVAVLEEEREDDLTAWDRKTAALKTHGDLLALLEGLTRRPHLSLEDHKAWVRLKKATATPEALEWAIAVTLRLSHLLGVADEGFEVETAKLSGLEASNPRTIQDWPKEQSLQEFIQSLFPPPVDAVPESASRRDPRFTVAYMMEVCGLKVEFVNSLPEHLSLGWQGNHRVLRIFCHKRYLQILVDSPKFAGKEYWFVPSFNPSLG